MIAEEAKAQDHLSVAKMCQSLSVSRIDYYGRPSAIAETDGDLELREKIQQIALEMSAYG